VTARPHAVVTGGGSGLGLAIARQLAISGHAVTIMGRSLERLGAALPEVPGGRMQVCDVADEKSVITGFSAAVKESGPVVALVNCAGIARTAPFERTSDAVWDELWRTNLMGVVYTSRAVLPDMRNLPSGRIVNIASTASLKGYGYVSAYVTSKHALLGLTRTLALELVRTGITVNAVCPGYSDTDIIRDAVATIADKTGMSQADALKTFTATNPQGRLIAPEEVAATVLWLVSAAARSVTGQAIAVAGGEIM
jgi:NAD(P)-dependent dehydrogenase (short-subunit alcohol dehydrogenase family)